MLALYAEANERGALGVGRATERTLTGYSRSGGTEGSPAADRRPLQTQVRELARRSRFQRRQSTAAVAGLWPGTDGRGELGITYTKLDRCSSGWSSR